MGSQSEVTTLELHELLEAFYKKAFDTSAYEEGTVEHRISQKCEYLYKLDYNLYKLDNSNGSLCTRYPGCIFIPESENSRMAQTMAAATEATAALSLSNGSAGTTASGSEKAEKVEDGAKQEAAGGESIQSFVTFADSTTPACCSALSAASTSSQAQQRSHQHPQQQNTIYEDQYDMGKIRELLEMAKYARCRQRFVVPVIMYKGKYVCRSATVSVLSETYGRRMVNFAFDYITSTGYASQNERENKDAETIEEPSSEPSPFSYEEVLKSDVQLLTALNVSTIVDLMVEQRKIKFFMAVSTSEKADNNIKYKKFNLLALPYPGCEFFRKFCENNYVADGLYYNWNEAFNDAPINIPGCGPAGDMDINWAEYRNWDLVGITQNYLKATLKYIHDDNHGVLIHCISGWDRTPLFISLVRLSMWADGLIHQSLNAMQITYLTIAYDWFLFGHQFPDRQRRREEIMFFCFHFLKHITEDEYSIAESRRRPKPQNSSGSNVIVVRSDNCDEEPNKEDYTLNFDQESNDSNSNSSTNCDSISITDNFFSITAPSANPLINRSPNQKSRTRTSPISVPGRQRVESTSSSGSWLVVTETGSIDSTVNSSFLLNDSPKKPDDSNIPTGTANTSTNGNDAGRHNTSGSGSTGSNGSGAGANESSSNTAASDFPNGYSCCSESAGGSRSGAAPAISLRKERLKAVRTIFIVAFDKIIGLQQPTRTFMECLRDTLPDNLLF